MRCTLLANGIDPGGVPLEDARDAAEMLVALGRAVPPAAWVASVKRRAAAAHAEGLPHNLV